MRKMKRNYEREMMEEAARMRTEADDWYAGLSDEEQKKIQEREDYSQMTSKERKKFFPNGL